MTKRFTKILCAFLSILMVMSILPVSVSAAYSHSCTKVYTCENANMHSYYTKCICCGKSVEGTGYAGWINHSYSSNTCTKCEYQKTCSHSRM
ncbi:MAG: hypothetical protein IJ325_02410 [Clostridia bacterium]|nr:hypothetical protein [Clostridia bacterium]